VFLEYAYTLSKWLLVWLYCFITKLFFSICAWNINTITESLFHQT
jgi:hypothetical protein